MANLYYISSVRSNVQNYQRELEELSKILQERNLSTFEYRACERNLQVSIETAIGVAKHWSKSITGSSSAEAYLSFELLSQNGQLTLDELKNWRKVIGLRNALVHDYLNIDPEIIRSIVSNSYFTDIFTFIQKALTVLEDQASHLS